MTYFTSRSRLELFQVCPRKRWLGSEYESLGLESTKLSLPLVVGSAIHRGVEVLLKIDQLGLAVTDVLTVEELAVIYAFDTIVEPVDIAVQAALYEFETAYTTHEVDATVNESMQFIHDEHAALIEGLLRLWAQHPHGLAWLVGEYEVLEVEKWDLKALSTGVQCPECQGVGDVLEPYKGKCRMCDGDGTIGGITLRSRADALLRKRSDGGLYVWSLKTANSWDKRRDDSGRHDVQGISEMVAIEERLASYVGAYDVGAEGLPSWFVETQKNDLGSVPRIDGTQMTYLLKGRRELDEKLNVYRIKSVLLHPWAIDAGLLGEKEFAHTYWYECELPHETGRSTKKGPVVCEGGKRHNIGTSWSQVNVWEHLSMKEWVAKLLSGEVQPQFPLPTFFINPEPYFRNEQETEDWVEQVTAQEQFIQVGLAALDESIGDESATRSVLNRFFIQHRQACDHSYGGKCRFVELCFGPSAIQEDPVGSGLFKLRERVEHEEIISE